MTRTIFCLTLIAATLILTQPAAARYVDGMNMYEYVQSQPTVATDPMGLSKRSQVEAGGAVYSCNCGWVDWGHARPEIASYWGRIVNETGMSSRGRNGYRLIASMKHGKFGITDGVATAAFVKKGLSLDERESVALAVLNNLTVRFEAMQANWYYQFLTTSGFSEEDFPSNLLGFYQKVRSISRDQVERECVVLTTKQSLAVWDETGGTKMYRPKWVANHWVPRYHHKDSKTARRCCSEKKAAKTWPAMFDGIAPAKKGPQGNWDRWIVVQAARLPRRTYDQYIKTPDAVYPSVPPPPTPIGASPRHY